MADIYVLQGAKDKGKSATLIKLCHILQNKYGLPLTPIKKSANGKIIDIKVDFTNKAGKKIGITSFGDKYDRIVIEINDFINIHCDIIFCACHLSGLTVAAINSFASSNNIDFTKQVIQNNTYTVPNTTITMQDKCNECMANHLKDKAGL